MTTISVPRLKPRNPLAAASRRRRAGAHRPSDGALRQRGKRELRAELQAQPRDWRRWRPSP